jgi:hypothetical protein
MPSISRAVLLPLVLLTSAFGAPAAAQQATGPSVSLRVGGAFSDEHGGRGVLAGVQVRGTGSSYALATVDVLMTRINEGGGTHPAVSSRVKAVPFSPPRLRLGMGRRARMGDASVAAEAFVGQVGVLDRFAPIAGGGLAVRRDAWAVTAEGVMHRAKVFDVGPSPAQSLPGEFTPAGHTWVPSLEVGARWDVGSIGTSSRPPRAGVRTDRLERPVLGGMAGGMLGAAAGFAAGAIGNAGCKGDESCLGPAIIGLAAGETLGVPVGVHVAEGRRGSLLLSTAGSFAVSAAGLGLVRYVGESGPSGNAVGVLVPMAQLALCTFIERHTGRRQ